MQNWMLFIFIPKFSPAQKYSSLFTITYFLSSILLLHGFAARAVSVMYKMLLIAGARHACAIRYKTFLQWCNVYSIYQA